MNDIEKRNLAMQTYNLGLKIGETFANDKHNGEYMVLAIMGCIAGLTNQTYSTMPLINYDGDFFKSLRLEKGFTLRQTEDATGISNGYLSQFETGKIKKPSQYVVNTLLNWYNSGVSIKKQDFIQVSVSDTTALTSSDISL